MILKNKQFFFQLLVVYPVVVTRTISNVRPFACQQTIEIVVLDALIGIIGKDSDLVGMRLLIGIADSKSSVRGAVFTDDNLIGEMTLLTEDTVERSSDGVLLIVGADYDGNHVLHVLD